MQDLNQIHAVSDGIKGIWTQCNRARGWYRTEYRVGSTEYLEAVHHSGVRQSQRLMRVSGQGLPLAMLLAVYWHGYDE
jgi:hypothetical protein